MPPDCGQHFNTFSHSTARRKITFCQLFSGAIVTAADFFFTVAAPFQGQGIGTAIVSDLCTALKGQGFEEVRLCRIKGNPQPEAFWHKNGFTDIGLKDENIFISRISLCKN